MKNEDQTKVFSDNLNKLLRERGLTQLEVANAINVSAQTFNTWCRGIAIPRMNKIQRLADYFRINKSALIDDPSSSSVDQTDSLFIDKYGQGVFDHAMKYSLLDDLDRGRINERIDMMLEENKYKGAGLSGDKVI